jgi:hypothetical protein
MNCLDFSSSSRVGSTIFLLSPFFSFVGDFVMNRDGIYCILT